MNLNFIDYFIGLIIVIVVVLVNNMLLCCLQLVWFIKQELEVVIKVVFVLIDCQCVNQYFGVVEGFVVYEVMLDKVMLVGVVEFVEEVMDGNEDKLVVKVDFFEGCVVVYVMVIGVLVIKKLMVKGIQLIWINEVDVVDDFLSEIFKVMIEGGVVWIDCVIVVQVKVKLEDCFVSMEEEGWQG